MSELPTELLEGLGVPAALVAVVYLFLRYLESWRKSMVKLAENHLSDNTKALGTLTETLARMDEKLK